MATEFFVIMQKRTDGIIYADLHKCTKDIYCIKEEADKALDDMGNFGVFFHVVPLIASTLGDGYNSQKTS